MATTLDERIERLEVVRDAILDVMENRATENHNSYSVNDRSITKMTLAELDEAYQTVESRIDKLCRRKRLESGGGGGIRIKF